MHPSSGQPMENLRGLVTQLQATHRPPDVPPAATDEGEERGRDYFQAIPVLRHIYWIVAPLQQTLGVREFRLKCALFDQISGLYCSTVP